MWGAGTSDSLNEGVFEKLDTMLGGVTSKSLTNVNVALTQSEANNAMLRLTGTLTGNVVISPDAGVTMVGFYYWEHITAGGFTVTFTNSAGSVVLPQTRRGIMWVDTTNGPRIVSIVGSGTADVLPTSTSIVFYNATVPSGWVGQVLDVDYAVRLVGNGFGGTSGGSVPFTTAFGRTATDSHTLTVAEIPSHSHGLTSSGSVVTFGGAVANLDARSGSAMGANTPTIGSTGGGNGHTHNIDLRVFYLNMVIGTRT